MEHFRSQHPCFLQPSSALLETSFFSSATLLHVYMGSCIVMLYTIALATDARRSQTVKCFSYFSNCLEGMTWPSYWDTLAFAGTIKMFSTVVNTYSHCSIMRADSLRDCAHCLALHFWGRKFLVCVRKDLVHWQKFTNGVVRNEQE